MAELAFSAVRRALIESASLPGTRTPARLAAWAKNTPELKLNLLLLAEAFLQLLASGIGTLALVWATVVLLGGFSTMLARTDFWFTTAIVFVETARIVGYNSALEAKFFVDVAAAFSEKNILQGRSAANFVRLLATGPTWIALAPIFAAAACISLSILRLVVIARHPYGGGSSTDASNGNLVPALILFYALVLTQGSLFLLWYVVAVGRSASAKRISIQYNLWLIGYRPRQREEGKEAIIPLIYRYVNSIAETCIQRGVSASINSNLVSFANELLQSQHPDDLISAVSLLHSLVVVSTERSERAVEQICSSDKYVSRLLQLLRSKDLYPNIMVKKQIAEIVSRLGCRLRLADMPGAAQCISSLLDPHPMKKVDSRSTAEIKRLILDGLLILGDLAADRENCTVICNTADLVAMIIAPVRNGLHMAFKDDKETAKIVRESLSVVAKLTSGRGESSTRLCRDLLQRYGRTAGNIAWIFSSSSSDQEMSMLAAEILSRLSLCRSTVLELAAEPQRLPFDPQDSPLKLSARVTRSGGEEFPDGFPDIQQLVTIISDEQHRKEYRYMAATAEMLAQICAKSRTDDDKNRLARALPTVLRVIATTETTNITEPDTRKFLASFLGLAVQMSEKLRIAEEFANAVRGLPMGADSLAVKLNEIIKRTTNEVEDDEVFLAIMKAAIKLVKWMMPLDTRHSYVEYFQKEKIADRLMAAQMGMIHIDWYVSMTTGADDGIECYETIDTLVATALKILAPPQQQQQ